MGSGGSERRQLTWAGSPWARRGGRASGWQAVAWRWAGTWMSRRGKGGRVDGPLGWWPKMTREFFSFFISGFGLGF